MENLRIDWKTGGQELPDFRTDLRLFGTFRVGRRPARRSDMSSIADDLARRLQTFAVRVARFVLSLEQHSIADAMLKQLLRSATSASANYRAARRGRSRAEFIAKLGLVVEEIDETEHWLEILRDVKLVSAGATLEELKALLDEATQLRAIFVRSVTTARLNRSANQSSIPKSSNP